jgi:hypothetical protein
MGGDGHVRQVVLSPEISWWHLDWLRKTTALPILLKGVLHADDARIAVERGVDGLIVSNHGGRQLDTAPATLDRLSSIVDAVGGRVPLLLDGGVRRGTDVVKALALGAGRWRSDGPCCGAWQSGERPASCRCWNCCVGSSTMPYLLWVPVPPTT